MTEQTQTEKLDGLIESAVNNFMRPSRIRHSRVYNVSQLSKEIKKACKESGLRFVGNKGDVLFGEEIEI